MKGNMGNPPGEISVPTGTKGNTFGSATKKFGEPVLGSLGAPTSEIGPGNEGDAPGVVTVASGTQGNHAMPHAGKPGDSKQGHHKYGG